VIRITLLHVDGRDLPRTSQLEIHFPRLNEERLFLSLVILAREAMPGGDVEDFTDVS
jgi:hypothetical protein